ncbi:MAG: AAA family ATPase, partial [Propionibacteriaceae bacterium]|nr:AAA family ATPase [Propionibacteriaceae bacterium]
EQDEAIRADYRGVTMISGGPGTGKTVVALHRVAYLLYSNRRRFENGGILVVGPSAQFLNYIERVLPSLGEDSVTLRAIGQGALDVLGFDATRADTTAAADIKGSLRMVSLLKHLVELPLVDQLASVLRVSIKGNVLFVSAERLAQIRHETLSRYPSNVGRKHAEERVLADLMAQVPLSAELGDAQAEDLITTSASYRMFLRSWWPDLTPTSVLARLADRSVVAKVAQGILSASDQDVLAASYAEEEWSVADIALLDELAALVGPVQPEDDEPETLVFLPTSSEVTELITTADLYDEAANRDEDDEPDPVRTYAHILIDEAQDLSPMQWRMLRRRGPHASWTIVGDPAQSSWSNPSESHKVINELARGDALREFKLTKNYRSPAEVFKLASQVIQAVFPKADLPHAVRSTGISPELLVMPKDDLAQSLAAEVVAAAQQVEGTVGIIAQASLHTEISAALGTVPDYGSLADRLVVLSPLECKGLEYDAAIVVSPDDIASGTPAGVRLLYVCLTRPTQRLITIDIDKPGYWRSVLSTPTH